MRTPNIEIRELPDGKNGIKLIPVDELVKRCAVDPDLRRAIDTMERAAGAPTELKIAVQKQLRHDMHTEMRVESQRRAIEFAGRKARRAGARAS